MEFCKSRFIGLWQGVVLLCLLQAIKVEAQSPNATYRLVNNKNFVVVKNYYLLNLLQAIPEAASFVKKDSLLQRMAIAKFDSLQWVITNNDKDIAAMLRAFMFSDAEIKAVSVRFAQLYQSTNLLGKIVQQHLIPSGCYYSYQNLAPVELLIKAWEQDANGVNFCLSVYAAGKKPNYPLIDSASIISYTKTGQVSPYYASTLHNISYLIAQQFSENKPQFDRWRKYNSNLSYFN
jgi:hypothetical protein